MSGEQQLSRPDYRATLSNGTAPANPKQAR